MIYKHYNHHEYYMKEQVFEAREDLKVYGELSELEHSQVKEYIDSPKQVMDLGCGLGRAGIYLNNQLNDDTVHFIMADTTGDTENKGEWAPAVYNKMILTKSFCELNGMKNFEVFDIFRDDFSKLHDVDLVMSHCSVGVHFPIEDIMPTLLDIVSQKCTMIFGLRREFGAYSSESFNESFDETIYIETPAPDNSVLPWQDWLILKRY